MTQWKTSTDYDHQAGDFDAMRRPGPEVVAFLSDVFSTATTQGKVLSIGCGTGQYEQAAFQGKGIIGLDQSEGMLKIAAPRMDEVVLGDMVTLPFPNEAFAGAYFVQSLHHVGANTTTLREKRDILRAQALSEAARVVKTGPIAVVQRDPEQNAAVWFWAYFPTALQVKLDLQPTIAQVGGWMEAAGIESISARPLDDPMIRGFYESGAPFDPAFRRAFSEFSYVDDDEIADGLRQLTHDIKTGRVADRIDSCRQRFTDIGGTVFGVSGMKEE